MPGLDSQQRQSGRRLDSGLMEGHADYRSIDWRANPLFLPRGCERSAHTRAQGRVELWGGSRSTPSCLSITANHWHDKSLNAHIGN